LEINGITLINPKISNLAATPTPEDWWTSLLISMSPGCCAFLESVHLSFNMTDRSQVNSISWGKLERALSPARCPRLRALHFKIVSRSFIITEDEVRERLPVLSSGGVVNLVVSYCSYHFLALV
jgi:hypothetical protein